MRPWIVLFQFHLLDHLATYINEIRHLSFSLHTIRNLPPFLRNSTGKNLYAVPLQWNRLLEDWNTIRHGELIGATSSFLWNPSLRTGCSAWRGAKFLRDVFYKVQNSVLVPFFGYILSNYSAMFRHRHPFMNKRGYRVRISFQISR